MNKDTASYSVILAGSLFFLAMTMNMPVTEVTLVNSSLFPRIVLGAVALMSAGGLYMAVKSGERKRAEAVRAPLFIGFAFLLGFIVLLRFFGFVIAAGAFIAAFSMYMTGTTRPKTAVIMLAAGFAVSLGINYVFTEILSFILP
ncbi:MAG: tripartite tricarboxylate transporter TctB family protein [Deltaproteobacteria bacterium]|jgi:hypothetical protein|nr:tripartite tricarboxylate transporter TctB family protein [Deltaproteobacteria bacterium]